MLPVLAEERVCCISYVCSPRRAPSHTLRLHEDPERHKPAGLPVPPAGHCSCIAIAGTHRCCARKCAPAHCAFIPVPVPCLCVCAAFVCVLAWLYSGVMPRVSSTCLTFATRRRLLRWKTGSRKPNLLRVNATTFPVRVGAAVATAFISQAVHVVATLSVPSPMCPLVRPMLMPHSPSNLLRCYCRPCSRSDCQQD